MATLDTCGEWLVTTCDKKLIAIHTKQSREPFVFDCSTAEKKPEDKETDNKSDGGGPEEPGNDKILAFAASPSGKLAALTDDSKRLILFSCDPSWQCICTRSVVRRCTSLVFSQAEDQVMAADKSGDVYSFSVTEPQKEGELKLGHLSMLLAIALTPNDKYIVTADRDEKIRVSHLKSPYNIQSFCLGHLEFVSALLIPSSHPQWLMSGSGDGTVKLWDYESGRKLDSWNMIEHEDAPSLETDKEKKSAVSRIASSPDGHHIAVQCERVPTLQFLGLDQGEKEKLVPCGGMTLPHCPLDMTFDRQGRLWVLLDSSDTLLQMYTHTQDQWKCDAKSPEFNRVAEALKPHLEAFQASARAQSRFLHLYKVNFDNMASYMQRKQQRLEQQKSDSGKKRTAGDVQKAANRAASKKAREDKSEAVSQTES
ncbi:tRNA (guanine-N(7)-)-methyltransferase non-catalytic subunit wdr4 isoform X2 [Lampris incognitus]|uniref:tRNA (guanine-N(7)-)-methyltransferase non-catalytic subunit wdr4 isoform X2 n=1 Tax=Lampris incognitus TaxID=2546036 RepID=UPI0024B4E0D5|nr:tRNA (guanine-N(7)-)-methyltransferase non-catalytic subunit wdr4 isoform X2 [Lampris incognitus]